MIDIHRIEAVVKHRMLWNKIAELIEIGVHFNTISPYKDKAFEELGIEKYEQPRNMCWCCEVTDCEHCLVVWENNPNSKCTSNTGEYYKLLFALRHKEWERAIEIAKEIANLPERN
jgi:hypothetical protein